MEKYLSLLSVLFIAAGIGFFLFHLQTLHLQSTNRSWSRLARRFRGELLAASLFQTPRVKFDYQGTEVLVDVQAVGGQPPNAYTQCRLHWPDPHFRCEVYLDSFGSRMGKNFLGMQDIEIGSPDFDRDYMITSNDDQGVRRLLSGGVQRQIELLRALEGPGDIYVAIGGGRLLFKKPGYLRDEESLWQFVQLSLDAYDQAMVATARGIEFVGEESGATAADAMCQICGETILQQTVLCRRCKTPHHMDCWQYFGACSTYGCGETKFVPASS